MESVAPSSTGTCVQQDSATGTYVCQLCSMSFSHKLDIDKHLLTHSIQPTVTPSAKSPVNHLTPVNHSAQPSVTLTDLPSLPTVNFFSFLSSLTNNNYENLGPNSLNNSNNVFGLSVKEEVCEDHKDDNSVAKKVNDEESAYTYFEIL